MSKNLTGTNTLAYFVHASATKKKCFVTFFQGVSVIKPFLFVADLAANEARVFAHNKPLSGQPNAVELLVEVLHLGRLYLY